MRLTISVVILIAARTSMAQVSDPGVITTRQTITPAGLQSVFPGRVHSVSFCGSDRLVVAVASAGTQVSVLSVKNNRMIAEGRQAGAYLGIQGGVCVPESSAMLTTATVRQGGTQGQTVLMFPLPKTSAPGQVEKVTAPARIEGQLGSGGIGGISATPDGLFAAMALTGSNEIALLDLAGQKVVRKVSVGIAPFTAKISPDAATAWVSNWGGRLPKSGERTATTGSQQREDKVLIDARGIAASGTVSRVDLQTGRVTDEIPVGLHPTALAWDTSAGRLYVADGNSDSISVIDTKARRVLATWDIQPFGRRVAGIAPTALGSSPDGKRLYVTCGGINAVAVFDTVSGRLEGLIPTGWYPSQIAISPDGLMLAVSTLLGVGSGADIEENTMKYFREELPNIQAGITRRYVHSYRGTVHLIPVPEANQLEAFTRIVAHNTNLPLRKENAEPVNSSAAALPVPMRAGEPSLIQHVVYIVKENRAYDQIFGDMPKGNGDPSLVIYGEDVTPNHRALASQFVLMDNFYATGGNSGDGHQWVTQAAESDYAMWPGYSGRSYPFDGNDPIAYASGGFLWDAALKSGKTFADFGEFIPNGQFREVEQDPKYPQGKLRTAMMEEWRNGEQFVNRFAVKSPIPPLDAHLVRDYPSYGGTAPDVVRARIFLQHLRKWEEQGSMPNLVYVQTASDHTAGTNPGWNTPKACVADNDLALGQIVEGLTHSKFWPHMAIYVVEDDAQGGVDHVDGHRTVALAISPYIRRQSLDSTFYSHPSIAKTIELQLGLPNLSLFDLIANDMRNSFATKPDLASYSAITPKQSLFELNPPASALKGQARKDAIASAKMDWSKPDAAPAAKLSAILWRNAKGYASAVPVQHNAIFLPNNAADDEDEERNSKNQRPRR